MIGGLSALEAMSLRRAWIEAVRVARDSSIKLNRSCTGRGGDCVLASKSAEAAGRLRRVSPDSLDDKSAIGHGFCPGRRSDWQTEKG